MKGYAALFIVAREALRYRGAQELPTRAGGVPTPFERDPQISHLPITYEGFNVPSQIVHRSGFVSVRKGSNTCDCTEG